MDNGFFKSMFDLSFKKFITLKVLSVVYVVGMIVIAVVTGVFLFNMISSGYGGAYSYRYYPFAVTGVKALDGLIVLAIGFIYWIGFRMTLEFIASVLRIAANTTRMTEMMEEDDEGHFDKPEHYS